MRKHRRVTLVATALVAIASVFAVIAHSAPPDHPPRVEDAIDDLQLPDNTRQKVNDLVDQMHAKERAARDEFLEKLKSILSPAELEKIAGSMRHGPPPRREDDRDQTAEVQDQPAGSVILTGGYETDTQDHGRPVVLVAAGLGVPTEVFRKAFSGVTPARGAAPEDAQVRRNKNALLKVLAPYGITNDRLDTVSNYYRYQPQNGDLWKHRDAKITVKMEGGKISNLIIDDAGAGYSSPPTVTITGYPGVAVKANLHFGTDLETNGSIESVSLSKNK